MNFSTLFRTKENLSLDKNTLTILRYIAIIGQILAISIVFYYLNLPFPIIESYLIISLGLATNLYLQFAIKINQLKDFYAAPFLLIDLLQLSALLYLTGGIFNPFSFLLVIPAIVSSTFLSMGTTIILGLITSLLLLTISFFDPLWIYPLSLWYILLLTLSYCPDLMWFPTIPLGSFHLNP